MSVRFPRILGHHPEFSALDLRMPSMTAWQERHGFAAAGWCITSREAFRFTFKLVLNPSAVIVGFCAVSEPHEQTIGVVFLKRSWYSLTANVC